jgi:hypothetical protein
VWYNPDWRIEDVPMVMLIVRGKKVGPLAQNIEAFQRHLEAGDAVSFESDAGKKLGEVVAPAGPICPWEPALDDAEIRNRIAQPGKPLKEIMNGLGAA